MCSQCRQTYDVANTNLLEGTMKAASLHLGRNRQDSNTGNYMEVNEMQDTTKKLNIATRISKALHLGDGMTMVAGLVLGAVLAGAIALPSGSAMADSPSRPSRSQTLSD